MYHVDTKELRIAMIQAGIDSIVELSEKTTVNRNTLGDILNGQIFPSSDVMVKIGETLSLPPEKCGAIFFSR